MKFFWCLGVMRGRTAVIFPGKGAACGGGTSMASTSTLPPAEAPSQPAISLIGRVVAGPGLLGSIFPHWRREAYLREIICSSRLCHAPGRTPRTPGNSYIDAEGSQYSWKSLQLRRLKSGRVYEHERSEMVECPG